MEKDRSEEFKESLEEAGKYPENLNLIEFRLKKRILHKTRKTFITGVASIAALFILFVLMVNTPTAMADAILRMPFLGKVAEYVCFDKGLQNAIKNEYVKEVNLIEENNGYNLGLPYLIADSKRLVLFFQISNNAITAESDYIHIDINKIVDTSTGKEFDDYYSDGDSYIESSQQAKDCLRYTSIRTINTQISQDLKIYVTLRRENNLKDGQPIESGDNGIFDIVPNNKIEILGEYTFDLHLEDYPEPKVTMLNKDVVIEGQIIRINSVTEYPLGTEISVNIPDNNDYIISSLRLKAIDSNGEEWGNPSGVTAIGPTSDGKILYYLAGNYFSSATLDKIQIDGISKFKKSEAEITIDLQRKIMTPELTEFRIKSIEKSGDKAHIILEFDSFDSLNCITALSFEYYDTKGNKFHMISQASSMEDNKPVNYLSVVWPEDNKVILTRVMTSMLELEKPVEIELKN